MVRSARPRPFVIKRTLVRHLLQKDIRSYAGTIALGTGISRILGYGREVLMAALFATSNATDAWLMASVLPNLLFTALYGSVSNLIVPLYLESQKTSSHDNANAFIQEVFTLLTVVAVVLTLVVFVFSRMIIHGLAPGFHGTTFQLTVTMTRIMLPTFLFWLWAGFFTALLQSLNIYGPPAWASVLQNIVRIAAIITLGRVMGIGGVAWGYTIGVGTQLVLLASATHRAPLHIRFRWPLTHSLVRKLFRLALPVVLTSLVSAMGLTVDRIFASRLATGSIAALNYSFLLIMLPISLVAIPLAIPVLTALSRQFIEQQYQEWTRLLRRSSLALALVMGILTVILILLRGPLIQFLYEHGNFGLHSAYITAGILPYFAVGMIAMALAQLFLKALVSIQYTATLSVWAIAAAATNILADFILVHVLQARGLALGTSLGNIVYACGLAWSVRSAIRAQRHRRRDPLVHSG